MYGRNGPAEFVDLGEIVTAELNIISAICNYVIFSIMRLLHHLKNSGANEIENQQILLVYFYFCLTHTALLALQVDQLNIMRFCSMFIVAEVSQDF